MKIKLPSIVSSPQDLTALTLEIMEYARWYQHESIKDRVDAKRRTEAPTLSPAATELLRQEGKGKDLSKQELDTLVKALQDIKNSAPTMTITLAAPPTNAVKADLVTWCRENISPGVLVNFQFNSTLLGGMVVRCGSRVMDWSFRRQILEGRHHFPEVLRHV